ncbi:response regulator [Henriciella sp. AS95]|uniref:response regulator n=1 Tax=Henriciella sp. AS95 TaxID=3135782 RepID=UPI003178F56A
MKSCLIVDDSRVVRKVAGRIVQDLQFNVTEAGDGSDALSSCRDNMPDAILLDWNMPVMNGLDFLRALRREPGGSKPVVVFCSTENDAEHIGEAMRSGANEFIMKPFDADIIHSKFAEVGLV